MSARDTHGQRAGWCVHYTAPPTMRERNKAHICAAGIDVGAVFRAVKFDLSPCFLDERGRSKTGALPCKHLRRPTPEEIAEHQAWFEAHMDKHRKVSAAVISWRKKHKGKSFVEVIECPACSGRLHLSIVACNGHVHGHCETKDCVSWME